MTSAESKNRVIYCGFGSYKGVPARMGGFATGARLILESRIFDHTELVLSTYTQPGDGRYVERFFEDIRRFRESLRENPNHSLVMMQVGMFKSIYREFALARMATRRGRRVVLDLRAGTALDFITTGSNRLERRLFRVLLETASLALVQCRSLIPELQRRYPGVKLDWFPNFIPETRIQERTAAPYAAGNRLKLVYFGYLIPEKGIAEMIEAVDRCRRERNLDVELHLIGEAEDENLRRRVEASTGESVVRHGRLPQDELWNLLREMHALLYPTSHWGEGHTNAVNEALMSGLAIVATRFRELPMLLPDEGTRWLDDSRLVESLMDEIEFLATNPDYLNRASRSNQAFVRASYTDMRWIPFLEKQFDAVSESQPI